MPVLVRYCNKCGIRIPPLDLETGRAVEHSGVYYCAKCAESLVVVAEVVEEEKQPKKKRPTPPKKHVTHGKPEKHAPKHPEETRAEYHTTAKPKSRMPLVMLIVVMNIILILVLVLLATRSQTGDEGKPEIPPDTRKIPESPVETETETTKVDSKEEEKLNEELAKIIEEYEGGTRSLPQVISRLEQFLKKPRLPVSIASSVRLKLDRYREALILLCREKMAHTFDSVERHLERFEFEEALKLLDEFPGEYRNEETERDIEREKNRIALERGAHGKYLELVDSVNKTVEEGELDAAKKMIVKWLGDFGGTLHTTQARNLLASVEEKIAEKEQKRRKKVQNAYGRAIKEAEKLAKEKKYREAARVLKKVAEEYPEEINLAYDALARAEAYEKMAAREEEKPEEKDIEISCLIDFTRDEVQANVQYDTEATAIMGSEDGNCCLSMPAPEASLLRISFKVKKIPKKLVLAIEHAALRRERGTVEALIDVSVNGKELLEAYSVGDEFRVDNFDIKRLLVEGDNTLTVRTAKKSGSTYILRRIGIADSADKALTPSSPGKNGGDKKKPVEKPPSGLFEGKSLNGWKTIGPANWEAKNGTITGKHTGGSNDVGFVFPDVEGSKNWLDYRLKFEIWSDVAGGWQVGLRTRESTGGLVSGNLLNTSESFSENKWWKIELRMVGDKVMAKVNDSAEFEQASGIDLVPGTLTFGVKPGATVKIKNIEFELLKSK